MKTLVLLLTTTLSLSGCAGMNAMMGLSSHYKSEGPIDITLLNGPVSLDLKDPKTARETLGRGKKMLQAGATVDALLLTTTGRKLDYLAEARRTHETPATIKSAFARFDEDATPDKICFIATLTHAALDLARASAWKFKVSIDEAEWIELRQIGRDDIPNYTGGTEWYSVGMYCGDAKNWIAARKNIRLNVFPPVFVNPGEAMLTWNIRSSPATKGGSK